MPSAVDTLLLDRVSVDTAPSLFPLRVQQLVYAVGNQRLINGINLTIEKAPCSVIMGPNGAGKSLLLRLLHGLLIPTEGEICWGETQAVDQARQRQALVFQRPVLLRRSVGANLRFVLKLRKYAKVEREERLQHVLELANLSQLVDRPARVLSIGEQQRLAIARALVLEPEVLLLDEPTVSLDPMSTAAVEELIHVAQTRGTKIILVTHDIGQARRLADDVIFLHQGRVVEHSAAVQFFQQPSSAEAQAYVDGQIVL